MSVEIHWVVGAMVAGALLLAVAGLVVWIINDQRMKHHLEGHTAVRRADDHSWRDRKRDQLGTIFIDEDAVAGDEQPDWERMARLDKMGKEAGNDHQ